MGNVGSASGPVGGAGPDAPTCRCGQPLHGWTLRRYLERKTRQCSSCEWSKRSIRTGQSIEARLALVFRESRRRAVRHGMEFSITLDMLMEMWHNQKGKCSLSGRDMAVASEGKHSDRSRTVSIDRIDSSLGYIPGNVQLVCSFANVLKASWSEQELYDLARDVARTLKRKAVLRG